MALVNPHGGGDLRPLLLPARSWPPSKARAATLPTAARQLAREGRHHHARHRRLHAARRLHDARRLAGRVRRHEDGERPVLADPDHAVRRHARRRRRSRPASDDRADRSGQRRAARDDDGDREVRDRQGARMRDGVPDDRSRAPRRQAGDGAGRGESRRPDQGAVDGRIRRQVRRAVHDAGGDARAVHVARLVEDRRVPDAQSDAPLARVPGQGRDRGLRRRARSIRCSARSSPATSRPRCAPARSRRWPRTTS